MLAAAHTFVAMQSLVTRNVDPLDSAVVSCTQIQGANANNVVPDKATLGGTVRTFRPDTRALIETNIRRIAQSVSEVFGATAVVDYTNGYPPTVNTLAESSLAAQVAGKVVGADNVTEHCEPAATSEDFAYMLEKKPGCYIWLGNADPEHSAYLHHPLYDFNDQVRSIGTRYWVKLAQTLLPVSPWGAG